MRQITFIFLLVVSFTTIFAQTTDSLSYQVVEPTVDDPSSYILVQRELRNPDGSFTTNGTVFPDTLSVTNYLAQLVHEQYNVEAVAIATLANTVERNRQINQISALVQQLTGFTYAQIVSSYYSESFIGRYRVRVNGTPFTANLIRMANGNLRLQREDDTSVRYSINILSDKMFTVRNLPGLQGDLKVAEVGVNNRGRRTYSDASASVTLIYLGPSLVESR